MLYRVVSCNVIFRTSYSFEAFFGRTLNLGFCFETISVAFGLISISLRTSVQASSIVSSSSSSSSWRPRNHGTSWRRPIIDQQQSSVLFFVHLLTAPAGLTGGTYLCTEWSRRKERSVTCNGSRREAQNRYPFFPVLSRHFVSHQWMLLLW